MRIKTDGNKAFRADLYERTAELLDENTKSGAIDAACIHARQDIEAKDEAIEYLAGELPPDQLEDVAEILSTSLVSVSVDTEFETTVSDRGSSTVGSSNR